LAVTKTGLIKSYGGREVRFCCSQCSRLFGQGLVSSFAEVDRSIVADQEGIYPMRDSVVTGRQLPARPVEFVVGNRLVRVASSDEREAVMKGPSKFLDALSRAVARSQADGYGLSSCPVSGRPIGLPAPPYLEAVVAGRLIRVCCPDCLANIDENPAKYIAVVDAARKSPG
jgi:YHS domain-containing protein